MLSNLPILRNRKTGRVSSRDIFGRNRDYWLVPAKSSVVLADISGPAQITHIWMTQYDHYRECLLKVTYDDAPAPNILVPLGDFFCLGHSMVNSFEVSIPHCFHKFPVPIQQALRLELLRAHAVRQTRRGGLVNESDHEQLQYFYMDYETLEDFPADTAYFHAEFHRTNPFSGWGPEIRPNTPEADAINTRRHAWENNYIILETKGRGHYIGCNLSVTNFSNDWWGEGDDMIWVDGYKWPPDLHGTGSEDYLGHAGGMQEYAALRNGSSIFEGCTIPTPEINLWRGNSGYQTGYVFHLENPVHFEREIKVTIEHGHANHLANEMSSVAYWYADRPTKVADVPAVEQRLPVRRYNTGAWLRDPERECPGNPVTPTEEMLARKAKAAQNNMGVTFASLPIIDSHIHFVHPERMDEMLALMDAVPCARFNLVCIPNPDATNHNLAALYIKQCHPGRAYISGALDYTVLSDHDQAPELLAAQILTLKTRGFDGLKLIEGKPQVRKLLPHPLDGPQYTAMWAAVEQENFPVVFHVNDPDEFWDDCPDWARESGWDYSDGSYPSKEDFYAEVDNILARHPDLKIIFAHFYFLSRDLERASCFLDAHPAVCFDLAPHIDMYRDFSRTPEAARAFFLRYQDRIIFGTDADTRALVRDPDGFRFMQSIPLLIRSFLEMDGEFTMSGRTRYHGLGLPRQVLEKIYAANFERMYSAAPAPLKEIQ